MHTPQIFSDLIIILLVSVPVAYLCLRVKLPLLVGLMLTGIAIGPYGFGLVADVAGIDVLAEVGVMLLLFTIGLEFSLRRLVKMKRLVLAGGGLQVVLTVAATAAAAAFLGRPVAQAIFFGFLVALSSTAIVLKSYVERSEIDSPHGRAGVGILLFQDISVVVMLLAVPLLGGEADITLGTAAAKLGSSVMLLAALVFGAWFLLPVVLKGTVRLRSPEVFILTIVLFCLAMSWVTSQLGLSLALGAFFAGMVLADSEYSHQAAAEILPFRDVFNSLFFVSIGMLLSVSALLSNFGKVALTVLCLIVAKGLIVWLVVRILGYPQRIAALTAFGLAQIGEFSFVLAEAGQGVGLLPEEDYQVFLDASIISMIATPFLIKTAPRFGFFVQSFLKDGAAGEVGNTEEDIHLTSSGGLQQHVIIVGYGLNGRNLARVLRTVGIPYTILELNAQVVRTAKEAGEKINFGDATRREVLMHARIDKAWTLVLAMSDTQAARRTVDQARRLNKDLHIIVRTRYVSEINELYEIGADEIIPQEFETSIEIFSRVLLRYGTPRNVIEAQIDRIRDQGYEMLRSTSIPALPAGALPIGLDSASTETIMLNASSPVIGKSLGQLDLRGQSGATVIAVLHDGDTKISPGAKYKLREGDALVLLGTSDKLERAKAIIEPNAATDIGGFNP